MKEPRHPRSDVDERARRKARLASLEADAAYFRARLEILGEPQSAYQLAQRKVFKVLYKNVGETILRAKRRKIEGG